MAQRMDGKAVSAKVKESVAQEVAALKERGVRPGLAVVIVGDDPASRIYVNNKKKACEAAGIHSEEYALPADTTQRQLLELVDTLNRKEAIHGILVQSPPSQRVGREGRGGGHRPPKGRGRLSRLQRGQIMIGGLPLPSLHPCGDHGAAEDLRHSRGGKALRGHRRSNIVGKPMAMLLLHQNGTVTVCHSRTRGLAEITRQADILVSAVGKANFVTADMVKPGAVVVDVGMNRDEKGMLCGDVDFAGVEPVASFITPVPGGVGPMTIAMLLKNTVTAAKLQNHLL